MADMKHIKANHPEFHDKHAYAMFVENVVAQLQTCLYMLNAAKVEAHPDAIEKAQICIQAGYQELIAIISKKKRESYRIGPGRRRNLRA